MDDETYFSKMYKRLRFLYTWSIATVLIGYALLWYSAGFLTALAVFFIHSSILAGSNADSLKNSIK